VPVPSTLGLSCAFTAIPPTYPATMALSTSFVVADLNPYPATMALKVSWVTTF
jgi:hypothetical protein